jgi:hypothetical protein
MTSMALEDRGDSGLIGDDYAKNNRKIKGAGVIGDSGHTSFKLRTKRPQVRVLLGAQTTRKGPVFERNRPFSIPPCFPSVLPSGQMVNEPVSATPAEKNGEFPH